MGEIGLGLEIILFHRLACAGDPYIIRLLQKPEFYLSQGFCCLSSPALSPSFPVHSKNFCHNKCMLTFMGENAAAFSGPEVI